MPRPTPFELVFASFAEERFRKIRSGLEAGGHDPADRDAFLMEREVVLLLHDLRPDEGLGEGIDQLAALVHHAYLAWDAGLVTVPIGLEALAEITAAPPPPTPEPGEGPRAFYAEFPQRRVWATVIEGEAPEPLEGCFAHAAPSGELRVLGVFGMRPERIGFSVVEVQGARPPALARPDGTPLFSPAMPGGGAARLYSIVGAEELLELGWRVRALPAATSTGAGPWTR